MLIVITFADGALVVFFGLIEDVFCISGAKFRAFTASRAIFTVKCYHILKAVLCLLRPLQAPLRFFGFLIVLLPCTVQLFFDLLE